MLTMDDLAAWLARGAKPAQAWRIGTEHEKIGFDARSAQPLAYAGARGVRALLRLLLADGGTPITEQGRIIGIARNHASVTLEPGGQLELSGAPLASIFETWHETRTHLSLLARASRALDVGFLSIGFAPTWPRTAIPWMPKQRYRIMRRYMPRVGGQGLDMMLRTATVQANLDFSDERDMARKMRIGACLQPLVTALFAASPFAEGRPSGWLSRRAACWLDTDPDRTGIPACIFKPDFGFEDYVQWALDVPMYFVIRDGRYIDCAGQSFRAFMAGKLPQLPGETPTLDDWALHLSTLFPDVRLKQYIEMRGADAGPWPWLCALPALWKGLLYEERARARAWDMIADWSHAEVMQLRALAPRLGFAAPFRDTNVHALCMRMLEIARDGLAALRITNARGDDESVFLAPLIEAVEARQTQAERWLHAWRHEWGQDLTPLFRAATEPLVLPELP
ncbi:MAG: glutamate--cysteine ligase [Zetaproteobacteria bacterium]|nr:MAG: glutamate--cysteine ligase [Zetaproteobacteria bacterium]